MIRFGHLDSLFLADHRIPWIRVQCEDDAGTFDFFPMNVEFLDYQF